MNTLIPEPDLMEWTGYKRRDALVNFLRQSGIPYLLGNKGKILVTYDAVNLPLLRIKQDIETVNDDIF